MSYALTRRRRGTGTIYERGEGVWVALAPQRGGRGAPQLRVASGQTREEASDALDAWLLAEAALPKKAKP